MKLYSTQIIAIIAIKTCMFNYDAFHYVINHKTILKN